MLEQTQQTFVPYWNILDLPSVLSCWSGGERDYFTGMMLKKSRITLLDSEIVAYPTTRMLRNLLVAQVGGHEIEACEGVYLVHMT